MKSNFRLFAVAVIALVLGSVLFVGRKATGSNRVVKQPVSSVANYSVPTATCTPPPPGLISWWPGEQDAGDATKADDIQGSNHGTLQGAATYATGEVGNGFSFTGPSDFVRVAGDSSLQPTKLTLDAWINPQGGGGYQHIVGKDYRGDGSWNPPYVSYSLTLHDLKPHLAVTTNGTINECESPDVISTGAFTHVAGTYDGSNLKVYVNGTLKQTCSAPGAIDYGTTTDLTIGTRSPYSVGEGFPGVIDELGLFDRALDASEISNIYNAGTAGQCHTPSLTINDASVPPGASGNSTVAFTVSVARPDPNGGDITVNYTTADNTAHAGTDYQLKTGLLTIPAGQSSSQPITVDVGPVATPKTFFMNLSTPANAILNRSQAVGTIASCDPPPAGLAGWWPGENNANDIQGSNNGTVQNGVSFANGEVGKAFSFNGTNQYVLVGDPVPASLQIQNEITLSAWIYVTAYPTAGDQLAAIIGSQYDTNHAGATIFLDGRTNPDGQTAPPGHIHFQIGDGSSFHGTNSNSQVPLNQWVLITATRKANEDAKIYYDGVSQSLTSIPWSGKVSYKGAWFAMGQQKDVNRPFKGLIDEPQVYNRALSETDVQSLYNAVAAGTCQTPSLSISDTSVVPGNSGTTNAVFTVNVARPNASQIKIDYATADGTATQPTDYTLTSGCNSGCTGTSLAIPANTASATISVPVNGLTRSSAKTFTLTLSNPVNAVINRTAATGTILTGDATKDFSTGGNPNGSWSYGYTTSINAGSAFILDDTEFTCCGGGGDQWYPAGISGDSTPTVIHNSTANDLNPGNFTLSPDMLALHPGPGGQYSTVRWIAPATGAYVLRGRFQGVDNSGPSTDVHIVKNLGTTATHLLTDATCAGSPGACIGHGTEVPFIKEVSVNTGDTIDFMVGTGGNGYASDTTGLKAEFVPGSLTCDLPPSGLVSWWTGDTDAKDFKKANNGTLIGGATAGVATGEVGRAFNLNAANSQYVSIPDSPSLHLNNLTIDAWVNFNSSVGGGCCNSIFGKGFTGGDADSYGIWYQGNALHGATCDGPSFGPSCTQLAYGWGPIAGVWYHVAYTFDGSTHKLFLDGRQVASDANTRVPGYDNSEVRIGADVDTGGLYPFDGQIDEVELFNRALSASEIAGIYNAGSAGNCRIQQLVTSGADSGAGTLRQAVLDAVDGDTIAFAPGLSTITLTSGEILLNKNITIEGPGASQLTVKRDSGAGRFRIFHLAPSQTVTISGLTISGGDALDGDGIEQGGAFFTNVGTTLTINDCVISGNRANGFGGAIMFGGTGNPRGALNISNTTFSGNTASDGGAIFVGYEDATISNSAFTGNTATGGGGAINASTSSGVTLNNSTLSGNSAGGGGGIYLNNGSVTVKGSTVAGNSATGNGGGFDQDGCCAFSSLTSTIVAKNTAGALGPDFYCYINDGDYNLIGNTKDICNLPGSHNITNTDPVLGPLANNGGSTQTMALLPGSPAIDQGKNAAGAANDQRGSGFPRIFDAGLTKPAGGDGADIGAFEVQTTPTKTSQTITVNTHAPASAAFNSQFTVAATASSGLAVSYTSSGPCSNTGPTDPTFTITSGTGICTVKYDQAGDSTYSAAAETTESVTAHGADQTITVNTHAPANANNGSQFTVAATASSNLGVTYSSSGSCSNNGATFTMTSDTGTCTVMYDQAGNGNYNAAPQLTDTVTAQPACAPPSGIVSWYQAENSPNDTSGGNNGAVQGGVTFATGEVGKAFSFNGTDGYVSTSSVLLTATDNWTMDAWINPATVPQVGTVMTNGYDDGIARADGYALGIGDGGGNSGNKLVGLFGGVAFIDSGYTFPAVDPANPHWYHVAMVRSSGTTSFYVNGVQTPITFNGSPRVPTEFRIGAEHGTRFFNGLVDEVQLFNRALSASEIAAIYQTGVSGTCNGGGGPAATDLSAVAGSGTYGSTANLTATLKSNGTAVSGKTISFTLNSNAVCGGGGQPACPTTNSSGVATLNGVDLSGINAGTLSSAVGASFAGDANYSSSSGSGDLTVNKATPALSVTNSPVIYSGSPQAATVNGSVPGSVSNVQYNASTTVPTNVATYAVTADFTPIDSTNYSNLSGASAGSFVINKATPAINWNNPADIVYGTALGNTQLNATATNPNGGANVAGTFVYNPNANTVLHAGSGQTLAVNFTPTDTANYNTPGQKTVSLNVTKATLTVTADDKQKTYRATNPQFTYTPSGFVNGDTATILTGAPDVTTAATTTSSVNTYPITITQGTLSAVHNNFDDYAFNFVNGTLTINRATPIITWNNPSDITYGTALGNTQLNATATNPNDNSNVDGTFTYSPASGTVQHAGNGQTIRADFAPADTANNNVPAQKTVSINVLKATLTVTADNKSKTYRAANPALTYTPSGFVNGDTAGILSGNPTLNTTANTSSAVNTYSITIAQGTLSAVHGGLDDYNFSFVNGTLTINKATPLISWSNPSNIVYGTALSGAQLNATATNPNDGSSIAGGFSYTPSGGTALHAGNNQTLAANFAPTDNTDYNTPAQKTVSINVTPATLTITADNKSRPLNTANPALTYTPTGFVNGDSASVLTGAPDLNTTAAQNSPVGDYPITIAQGSLAAADYVFNFVNGNLAVGKTIPVITWTNPADIVYGTALSGTQLNATAADPNTHGNVPGTFTYTPAAGTVLHVGANQTLQVTFAPSDTTSYSPPAQKLVSINVTKAALTVTADNKAKTYRATNPTLTFTPSGFVNGDGSSVLSGGPSISTTATATSVVNTYPINITQNNLSAADYTLNFVAGTLTVNKVTPAINWSNPADIVYGTALSGTQLNATATNPNDGSSVAGAFAYTPGGGTVLHVGSGQTLKADFTPNGADASSYFTPLQKQVLVNVTKATLTITADNKSKAFGAALPQLTFTPTGFVNGDTASVLTGAPTLQTTATPSSPVGSYPITGAQGTLAANDYAFSFVNGTLTVGKIMPVINWTNPADIVYGTALSAVQLNATAVDPNTLATVAGTFTYGPAAGTVLHAGNGQTLGVNFAPTDTSNYGPPPAKNVSINVVKATLTINADNKAKSYRAANPAFTFTASGFVNGDNPAVLTGAPSFSPIATTVTAGGYPIVPGLGSLSASDYGFNFASGTLTVNPVTPVINWSNPADILFGTALSATQLNATATNPNDSSSVAGAFVYTPAASTILNAGLNQILTANFTPNGSDASSYTTPAAKTASINVVMAAQTITFATLPNKLATDPPFTVSATSSSGLPVTFSIVAGPATISGNTVTITGAGSVTVRATQAGSSNFNAASSVDQSFIVTSAPGLTPSNGAFVASLSPLGTTIFPIFETFPTARFTRGLSVLGIGSTWSPDGTKIAYSQVWSAGAHFHLSVANSDGSNPVRQDRIGNGFETDRELDTNPAWSPDGKSIAYNCDFAGDGNAHQICIRKLDSLYFDAVQEITTPIRNISGQGAPAWSPDSKKLVFSAVENNVGGVFALYVYDLSAKTFTRLTNAAGATATTQQPFFDMTPSWSPDGTRIAYRNGAGLFIVNPDGTNKQAVPLAAVTTAGGSPTQVRSPKWSADMKQIAFIDQDAGNVANQYIRTINIDGTNLTQVYSNSGVTPLVTFDWQVTPVDITTPTGTGVRMSDGPGSLNFSQVNTGGTTSVLAINPDSAGSVPGGFAIDGSSVAWDVTTTASYTGPVEVCFYLPVVPGETAAQFNARRIMHGENGVLVDRTSRHDFASRTICANVNSLSPFAVLTNLNPSTTNEIDDQTRFVGQHYLDFLERPADPTGQAFWVGTITSCGSDQNCIAVKRINASGAFFMSIEFQQEGYLVERTYKAAFGDNTAASTLNGNHQMTVPIVRFGQFLSDTAEVGQGVVVNQGNWQSQLDANKDAFLLDFVQRQGFIDAYPTTMTPAQFVNKLFTNSGVTPAANELATALGRFGSAGDSSDTTARAKALRDVAENATFMKNETNRAWVLMEYFGYLRRNPNEGQDTDYTGYDYWLAKLNQFNGDFIKAEMVNSFISSREYRQRFGP
jgi:hypothetical protein